VNGQIAFARYDPTLGDTVIYTVNPDGSHEQQAIPGTPVPNECPQWSPDGTVIATCGGPNGAASLIINPDNGSTRVVPNPDPADLFLPCGWWSSEGTRLYCEGFGLDRLVAERDLLGSVVRWRRPPPSDFSARR
jgi:hypothetical protein